MTRYFAQNTPRAGLEHMMMSVPGFQKRGGGMMILSRFCYKPEDVDCRYCLHYRRRSCQVRTCPYIAERLKSGAIEYLDLILEYFGHIPHAGLHKRIQAVEHWSGPDQAVLHTVSVHLRSRFADRVWDDAPPGYPQDNREFVLRPASLDEVGLFYSEEKLDEALGTVGHLRMDFGHGEKEFWHTWWPHNEDRFNTPEFKEVLQRFVDDLRQTGLLKNLGAMDAYCWQHGGSITEDRRSYGYIAETENYRFCLRCTPFPGEYQGYLYCYDLCQQEMYRQEHPVVGRVTFASGEQQEFTDSKALLQAIREELPFRSTTGFRFETLTDDPEVKKAVDDILLDFAGEDNSRRTCNYGLTETGKQALRKAADPSIPHTYAWFVMADTNTPQEIIRQDLTLEEAIQIYQDSNTSEKRLGVIKDGIATVDFVHFQSGEQQFFTDHEKLESFRSDLVVAEAMERLYQQLNQPDIGIRMGEM